MSDPRYTDPRYGDSRMSDPVSRYDNSVGGVWGWIAGIGVVALIAFFLIAGGHSVNRNTASNGPSPTITGSTHTAPTTTGQGPSTHFPENPAPASKTTQ
jgi:hypothetical protein